METEETTSRRVRLGVVGEALLTLAALALVGPLLYDSVFGTWTEWSARLEHGLTLAWTAPLRAATDTSLLSTEWTRWQDLRTPALVVAGVALALTGLAALLDPTPGTPFTWRRRLAAAPFLLTIGVPVLVVSLSVILLGILIEPAVFTTCFVAVLAGSVLGGRCRREPVDWERGVSGLPPAFWKSDHLLRFMLVLLGLELLFLGAALGLARSDQLLLSVLSAMERGGTLGPAMLGNGLTMGVIVLLLLAPITRRTLGTLTWEPWAAGVIGLLALGALMTERGGWWEFRVGAPMGFAAGVTGTLMAAAGMPLIPRLSANPIRSVGRLYALLLAALMALGFALSTGFLGCSTVADDSRIETLVRSPSAAAVEWVEGNLEPAAFVALPNDDALMRVGIPSGDTRVVTLGALPLEALRVNPSAYGEGPAADQGLPQVIPTEFGRDGHGQPFMLYALSDGSHSGVVELDVDTGAALSFTEDPDACTPGSWAWHPTLRLGVIGCSDKPELALYESSLGKTIARQALTSGRALGATSVDPRTGALLALAPGRSPFLLRLDVQTGRPRGWRFLGMANRALTVDATGMAHVPRFLGRTMLSMDSQSLGPVLVGRAGLASSAVAVSQKHARVLSVSTLDGHMYASRPGEPRKAERIRVGGYVRDLTVSDDGSTALVAGFCGVLAVDLDRWLGDD